MKLIVRASLLLALSYTFIACGSDWGRNNADGYAGVGGSAGGALGSGGGGKAGHAEAGDFGDSAGAAGNTVLGDGGSSDGGEAGAEAGPLSALLRAFCGAARSCCSSRDALEQCEHNFSAQIDAVALVAAGTLEVNASALTACVAAYQRAKTTCTLSEVRTTCHGLFAGVVPDGGKCSSVVECDRSQAPKVCLRLGDGARGTCLAAVRGTSGTACAGSCPRGENCSTTTFAQEASVSIALCHEEDGLYCPIGEGCAPLVADGEACTWNEACGSDGFCVSTCNPRAQLGESCQYDYGCAKGLACNAGKCAEQPFATDDMCQGTPPELD